MKALRFAFLALLVFLFSCDNGFNSYSGSSSAPESKNHTVKCYISLAQAIPEEVVPPVANNSSDAKSAVPTINTTDYYYFVEAVKSDGTKKEYGKEQAANFITTSSAGMIVFEFPLEDGSWTVTSGVKNQENETVLSYTIPEPVVVSPDETVLDLHFVVRPHEGGFGKIQLDFFTDGLSSDFSVSRIMAECNSPAWKSVNEDSTKCDLIPASGKATLNVPSIASGAYEITFTFYDSSSIILYQTTQTINVLAGMTTKRWVSGGGADDAVIDEGKLTLNTDAINDFARRIFYVGDTKHGTASGDGEGTAYKPFNSLEKALATIEKTKSSSKDYIIHLTGTQTAQSTMASGRAWVIPEGIKSLTIVGDNGLKADGMPDAVLNGNKKGSVLEAKSPLILKNVQITGGYANGSGATASGGGIYIDSGIKVTLDSGTLIGDIITPAGNSAAKKSSCGNYAYKSGGGIYMKDATLVVKSGAKICHNYSGTGASAGADLSYHEGSGGGISCEKGTITLENGSSVSYNGTEQRGGGIHLLNPSSGNTVLVMNGAEVSYNETIGWGGGIMMGGSSVKVTIKDSSVSYNKCVGTVAGWGPAGGGFFIDGGNLTIKGDSIIERNETYYGCGAIDPRNPCSISFEGGIIRNNTASSGCGAISLSSGKTYNFSGSIYIPHGIDGDTSTGKNGLVLGEGAVINVAGNLIAPADGSKNAYITPANWSRGLQVLTAATAKLIEDNASKFGTADDDFEVVAKNTAGIIDAPIYVASSITTGTGARKVCTGEPGSGDDARGTRAKPFATMSQAIALLTDSTVDYEIRIDGTISGRNAHTAITGTTQAASVLIHGANGDNTNDALNQNNLDVSNNGGSVLVINNDIPVTIKNLKITGGNASGSELADKCGGGIKILKGIVNLDSGAIVANNYAAQRGGGVYVDGGSSRLNVKPGAVIGNSAASTYAASDTERSNFANYGAGIFAENNAIVDITGGSICYNYASAQGGALGVNGATANIGSSPDLTKNGANNNGGALYIGSTPGSKITLSQGTIQNCFTRLGTGASVSLYPGGIFEMGADAYIPYNSSSTTGAKNYVRLVTSSSEPDKMGYIKFTAASNNKHNSSDKLRVSVDGTEDSFASCPVLTASSSDILTGWLSSVQLKNAVPSGYGLQIFATDSAKDSTLKTAYYKKYYGTKLPSAAKAAGDIIFSDASATPYSSSLELSDGQKAAAVAVYYDTSNKLAVGLKQYYDTTYPGSLYAKSGVSGYESLAATSPNNGAQNTQKVKALSDFSSANYPIFYWVANYGVSVNGDSDGWYIPAKDELKSLYDARTIVNDSIAKIGTGEDVVSLSDIYYWSSTCVTADGFSVNVMDFAGTGTILVAIKANRYGARAIRKF